jgi:hypothetical protein
LGQASEDGEVGMKLDTLQDPAAQPLPVAVEATESALPGTANVVKWAANIALFVGTEVVYVALFAAAVQTAPGVALTTLLLAVAFTIPFLPLYLGALAVLPHGWSHRQRRASAIVAGPLLLTLFVLLSVFAGGFGVSLLIIALPGALAYGALVRLPRRREGAA